jgi:hypothetical protein
MTFAPILISFSGAFIIRFVRAVDGDEGAGD